MHLRGVEAERRGHDVERSPDARGQAAGSAEAVAFGIETSGAVDVLVCDPAPPCEERQEIGTANVGDGGPARAVARGRPRHRELARVTSGDVRGASRTWVEYNAPP